MAFELVRYTDDNGAEHIQLSGDVPDFSSCRHGVPLPKYEYPRSLDGTIYEQIVGYVCPFCGGPGIKNFCPTCGAKMDKKTARERVIE